MSSWDDLRLLLAVARAASIRGAARRLGVNHATVSRKLAAFEERLGQRLVDRSGRGLELTPAGADVMAVAEQIETDVRDVERRVAGGDLKLEGTIRVALPPRLLSVFGPYFGAFVKAYPTVRLDFATATRVVSLTRRDADVALRVTGQPQADLFGRQLGTVEAKAWISRTHVGPLTDRTPADWPWVTFHPRYNFGTERWIRESLGASVVATVESGRDLQDAVITGVGAGYLLDNDDDRLMPVPNAPSFQLPLWLLTHHDLRNVARIRAFMRFIGDQHRARSSR